MMTTKNNYAFIDSQNVNLAIQSLGWKLDFARFRVYLKEKYGVTKAFLFIGYVEGNLVQYLLGKEKLSAVVIPNRLKFSALLKFKSFRPYLRYMNDLEQLLAYKKKRPHEDKTS